MSKRKPWQTTLLYLFVFVVCIVIIYPYFVMFTTAAKTDAEMYAANMTILPLEWQWSNFINAWKAAPVFKYFLNSLIVAGGATLVAIGCGIPAAYAMARMRFKGKGFFLGAVIMSQMFSPVVLLVGIYKLMVGLNLSNSLVGLVLLNAAFNQAFAIWLLRGTFLTISAEMEQAAKIDGCGTVQALLRVLLPVSAPGIVTALIFVFINAWNEYTIALTLIQDDLLKPITVGINIFYGYNFIQWQYLFATSLFATIPVIVLFLCIEKHLVAGLTAGGVKG
ncbi:MAG: carbohydrate ABC transporter permease [Oscillibacter sp.]|jgi:multiple sugar transport system permease protein|nr:carbohydrate ABC transporter permease [Oscillibacter sp.]MCI8690038.1 carbohydrate ABC transporter permease [Oscillibacter sp.]MCI9481938.1 carbohydrate ABC transporter permease [Oscillibacter sp.]